MSKVYEVRIADPFGAQLAVLRNFGSNPDGSDTPPLEYALNVGQIGVLRMTLTPAYDDLLLLDGRVEVWISINGRPAYRDGDAVYRIRRWDYGEEWTTITAVHENEQLTRRIIDYYAGTTYTSKTTTTADNMIKAFASENLGSGIIGADRIGVETQADISSYLTLQSNLSAAQSVSKAASWRNLFDVVRELCDASTQAGTYLTADIVGTSTTGLELRTYTQQRGVDRRFTSGNPLIFSRSRGNLENVVLTVDRMDEITFVTAGGGGEQSARTAATAIDTTRMGESPFNRREAFTENTNTTDSGTLTAIANTRLREGRPRITLAADLVETNTCTRGVHFDLGDYVTIEHRNQQYNTRIDVVSVSVGAGEQKSVIQFRVNQ